MQSYLILRNPSDSLTIRTEGLDVISSLADLRIYQEPRLTLKYTKYTELYIIMYLFVQFILIRIVHVRI